MKSSRPYRQTARAEAAEQTRRDIMEAAVTLWRTGDLEQVTLRDVADEAGVTVQTVIRKFGSKEGLLDACIEEKASGVEAMRDEVEAGDVGGALDVLLAHYERDGDGVMRTLSHEDRWDSARRIAEHGRRHHRAWCARVFGPYLPRAGSAKYETRLDAFVAATDLYLWKLLRRDLGRDPQQVRRVFEALLEGLTRESKEKQR